MPTQETIVLLCLRLLYDEGAEKSYFVDSSAQILVDEEEIQTVFSSMGGSRTLRPGELREILTTFKRKGLVSFDQNNSLQVTVDVQIRPTITEVVDSTFLARLEAWGGHAPADDKDADASGEQDVDEPQAQEAPVREPRS